jgi:hypothetical protein
MFPPSNRWMMFAAAGQGVLFSLALVGAVRIGCLLAGHALPESIANSLFMASSVLTDALGAWSCSRFLRNAPPAREERPMSVLRRPLL